MAGDSGRSTLSRVGRAVLFLAVVLAALGLGWAYTHPAEAPNYTRACGFTTAGAADVETLDAAAANGSQASAGDPDGDGLPTAVEREYGSDPLRKSLYLHLVYGADQPPLAAEEQACLQERWARLPIANPDGSDGVELFFRGETRLEQPLSFDETIAVPAYFERNLAAWPAACVDHVAFVGESRWPGRRGVATIGGYASIVDVYDSSTPLKFLSHELLHNVVGFLDDDRRIHTRRGLLSTNATDWSLSAGPRRILDETGFRRGYGGNTIYGNCQGS